MPKKKMWNFFSLSFFASFEFQGRKLALIVASCGSLLIYFLMPLLRPKGGGTYNTYVHTRSIVSNKHTYSKCYFRSLLFENIFKIQILIKVASCCNFNLNLIFKIKHVNFKSVSTIKLCTSFHVPSLPIGVCGTLTKKYDLVQLFAFVVVVSISDKSF